MHAAKYSQVGTQPSARSLTAIAMHLSHPIPIYILRPFPHPILVLRVAHAVMDHFQLILYRAIPRQLVRVEDRCPSRCETTHHLKAGRGVSIASHEVAHLSHITSNEDEYRRAVTIIRATASRLVCPAPGRVLSLCMPLAFFPRHSDIAHRPRTVPHPRARL
jgi:hypothetical protein